MRSALALSFALCLACTPEAATVEVQLVTDYTPEIEFDSITTSLGATARVLPATGMRSYARAVRVAFFEAVPPERVRVTVALASHGTMVQLQPRIVDLRPGQTTVVTVSITRDCQDVLCPTDVPSAIACLGGRCVEPGEDSDADGVLDLGDDCPTIADPFQDDEDDDGLGDACDPCPPVMDGDPVVDRDHDGVSDACDPRPMTTGDRIVRFEGFEHYVDGSLALSGTWSFSGGQAIAPSALNQVSTATIARPDPTGVPGSETVSTHAIIDAYFGTDVARPVGVVHELSAGAGILCVFGTNPSNLEVFAIADDMTLGAFVLVPTAAPVGAEATFMSYREGDAYTCTSPSLSMPMTATSPYRSATPGVGLYTRSLSARFDWLLVTSHS